MQASDTCIYLLNFTMAQRLEDWSLAEIVKSDGSQETCADLNILLKLFYHHKEHSTKPRNSQVPINLST